MAKVFVSYDREDSDFAELVQGRLEKAGHDTVMDADILNAGDDWRDKLDQAIKDAHVLLVIMTPEADASKYVAYEWAFAMGAGLTVIPLELQATTFHSRLGILQRLDFTNKARPWSALLTEIEKAAEAHAITTMSVPANASPAIQRAVNAKARVALAELSLAYTADTFVDAAERNDLYAIDLFITAGMDPNVKNRDGSTALIAAALSGDLETVSLLLANVSIDPNIEWVRKKSGYQFIDTALSIAVSWENMAIVKVLLQAGANINLADALRRAAIKGNEAILRMLLQYNASRKSINDAFYQAVIARNIDFMRIFVDHGADVYNEGRCAMLNGNLYRPTIHGTTETVEAFAVVEQLIAWGVCAGHGTKLER
ncbi:MAG: TIR domain-containing protein [Gammaproteobacteria bacterium]|nr:TIR domain-containing protein [Gammaproteobacteria bacterium]